jgi:hypothetical protein
LLFAPPRCKRCLLWSALFEIMLARANISRLEAGPLMNPARPSAHIRGFVRTMKFQDRVSTIKAGRTRWRRSQPSGLVLDSIRSVLEVMI